MLVDAAAHASGAYKRLISLSYLCFGGKAGGIRNTGSRQKKQTERNKQSIDKISPSGERNFASRKSSPVELFAFVG